MIDRIGDDPDVDWRWLDRELGVVIDESLAWQALLIESIVWESALHEVKPMVYA